MPRGKSSLYFSTQRIREACCSRASLGPPLIECKWTWFGGGTTPSISPYIGTFTYRISNSLGLLLSYLGIFLNKRYMFPSRPSLFPYRPMNLPYSDPGGDLVIRPNHQAIQHTTIRLHARKLLSIRDINFTISPPGPSISGAVGCETATSSAPSLLFTLHRSPKPVVLVVVVPQPAVPFLAIPQADDGLRGPGVEHVVVGGRPPSGARAAIES
ncbi:hypothetical protein F4777DRAFT_204127 [Nemania sp. FL0916]|nr:hypothetical protein F4777DRAFT_204127 [Nemania sp. FL0916]